MNEKALAIRPKTELSEQFSSLMGIPKDSEQYEQVAVLMAMLYGLTEHTFSGDVVELSIYRAKDICKLLDIPEDEVNETLNKFKQFAKAMRNSNPMANALFGKNQ